VVDRLPIRWRLALGSALLTFLILSTFATVVGMLTTRRIQSDFDQRMRSSATELAAQLAYYPQARDKCPRSLGSYGLTEHAYINIITASGDVLCANRQRPPWLGLPYLPSADVNGMRVENRPVSVVVQGADGREEETDLVVYVQYARSLGEVEATQARVRTFLALGVLGGTALALLAGLAVARRAMAPITELTAAAREVKRTRDPSARVPHPKADDEVAELARTLEEMLTTLDAAQTETEEALHRQRQFVADASHELRTPLTSVLANLELLAEQLEGEPREAAESALRSSRRMRRLVADLLLLARADAGRTSARREPTDLAEVLLDVAAELGPLSHDHELVLDPHPAVVVGARDELHRMVLNLIENAVRHTPPGTEVHATVGVRGDDAVLEVADDGPGVRPEVAPRIFERFVRGGGDRAGSSGLGLAIVRAVAEGHGGSVTLEPPGDLPGARFVVRLPAAREQPEPARSPAELQQA
jgi:signal transduction histidine kinase